jgi:lantibiotic modifying enzyme
MNDSIEDHSLFYGKSGIIMALINYYHTIDDSKPKAEIETHIINLVSDLVNDIETRPMDGSLMRGITGLAYSLRWAHNNGFAQYVEMEWFDEIDKVILSYCDDYLAMNELDLLRGASGIIIYLLKFDLYPEYILKYVSILSQNARWEINKCYWVLYSLNNATQQLEINDNIVNMGLAHGMPMLISILGSIYNVYGNVENCKELLLGACKYVIETRITDSLDQFGGVFYRKINKYSKARLGWCYGDSCVGFSIIKSGIICKDKNLFNIGLEICQKSTQKDFSTAALEDHGFCHGFFGAAYLYHKLYKITGKKDFCDISDYWLKIADENRLCQVHPLGYFCSEMIADENIQFATPALLVGLSGILLSMLSIYEEKTDFDDLFLLNI